MKILCGWVGPKNTVAGMPADSYERIFDREEAIAHVLRIARPGDTVLLVGKGHETYQQIGQEKNPFNDADVVRSILFNREARA